MVLSDKFYMILSALLFALMTMFIKMVSQYLPSYELLFFRFAGGAVICILADRFCFRFSEGSFSMLFFRSLYGTIAMLAFFYAIYFTSTSRVGILHFSYPIFEIIFSAIWLKEKPEKMVYISLPLAIIGIYYITDPVFYGFNKGDILALLSAIFASIAIIIIRKTRLSNSATTIFFYFCLFGMLVTAVPTFLQWKTPDTKSFLLISIVILSGGAGQILMTHAYKSSGVGEGSIISVLAIVFINILGFMFLKEPMTLSLITGELLVMISILFLVIKRKEDIYLE